MTEKKKSEPPAPPRPAPLAPVRAAPEILVSAGAIGRETLAAISEELRAELTPAAPSAPELRVSTAEAGRETLSAISREVGPARPPLATLPYGDMLPNAPGAVTPAQAAQLLAESDTSGSDAPASAERASTEVFEVLTFLVRSQDPGALGSEEARRAFVARRLRQRLPGGDLDGVARIEVTPWTERETLMLRVWCRVAE